ncbi:hypothetical protein QFZ76_000912 [Streptomyces sp. V4I2]|nr:hypothetical protein [Streptomyces sp. V4I2]
MTAEVSDEQLREFLADPVNSTLELSTAVARCTKALGLQHAVVYLADLQQRSLVPLTDIASTLPIDGSLAGWTYRTQSLRVEESGTDGMTAWFPLLDGAERLGVLAVHARVLTAASLTRGRALGALLSRTPSSAGRASNPCCCPPNCCGRFSLRARSATGTSSPRPYSSLPKRSAATPSTIP